MAESKTDNPRTGKRTQALDRTGAGGRERGGLRRWNRPHLFASPFEFMDRMGQEMDRTFDRLFRDYGGRAQVQVWAPRIEAFQKEDRFVVRAELPGMKKDDIHVDVTDEAITIQGERRLEHSEEQGYHHSEVSYGQFYRTIPLPQGAIAESAKASCKDGVLEITVQAAPAEANRGRRIQISDSAEEKRRDATD